MTPFPLIITALITPFKEDGSLDLDAFKKLVQHQLDHGLNNLLLLGTTGESLLLEKEERFELIKSAMKIPGVSWWLSCAEASEKKAQEWLKETADLPIKGYLILAPYYIKPSQEDIESYFKHLLDISSHPCLIYNNPSRCGVSISESVCISLLDHPRFLGIKDCDLNPLRVYRLSQKLRSFQHLLVGDDAHLSSALCSGATGIISVLSNALPTLALDVVHGFFDQTSVRLWQKNSSLWIKICQSLENFGNPKGIKALLHLKLGINSKLRAPLLRVEGENLATLSDQVSFLLKDTL